MDALSTALETVYRELPPDLVRPLTWDQGKEIGENAALPEATGLCFSVVDPVRGSEAPT